MLLRERCILGKRKSNETLLLYRVRGRRAIEPIFLVLPSPPSPGWATIQCDRPCRPQLLLGARAGLAPRLPSWAERMPRARQRRHRLCKRAHLGHLVAPVHSYPASRGSTLPFSPTLLRAPGLLLNSVSACVCARTPSNSCGRNKHCISKYLQPELCSFLPLANPPE